ncbi:5-formyltetrahydrofolate cyclo-ligase [Calditerrivibrio sp.]|jgi:5-formyltetrahydrofolate cyclo-ligase|uniref:5-formyltetrahydrofolate cyclo-ligase n=1 Tax=Calditerrivibrio sp. TaxID=2792612 RepID=UPI003D13F222
MRSKEFLRREMLNLRNGLSLADADEKSRIIGEIFLNLFGQKESFLLYSSVNNEVRTKFIIDTLYKNGKLVYLPKYSKGGFISALYNGETSMVKGKFGVMEPDSMDSRDKFDVIAIPGVVFGLDFNRIGMGKGYYDTMLKKVKGLKVGLSYQFQIVDGIDTDPWDEKMDMIITEENIYRR